MDRFAFLACQPYLLPPARDTTTGHDTRSRAALVVHGVQAEDTRASVKRAGRDDSWEFFANGVHESRPRGPHRFVGCASFHFSQVEQYAPSTSPDGNGSPTGAWRRPDIVGAAADDALHIAFEAIDSNPDQAQLRCELTIEPDTRVELRLDGARFELDMRQCRAVVEGFPPGGSSDEGSEAGADDADDARGDAPPPYASCVFSHATLNLYKPIGCSGQAERDAIRTLRSNLERARAVAWTQLDTEPKPSPDDERGMEEPHAQWVIGAGILCDAVMGSADGQIGSALTDAASALAYAAAKSRARCTQTDPGDANL